MYLNYFRICLDPSGAPRAHFENHWAGYQEAREGFCTVGRQPQPSASGCFLWQVMYQVGRRQRQWRVQVRPRSGAVKVDSWAIDMERGRLPGQGCSGEMDGQRGPPTHTHLTHAG